MAIIRLGKKAALLVVDVQVGVMHHAWDSNRVIKKICTAVKKARNAGFPVIWVQHSDEELVLKSEKLAMGAGTCTCRERNPDLQAVQLVIRTDSIGRFAGTAWDLAHHPGWCFNKLVYSRQCIQRFGSRL